jgi:hypothetical protein
MDIREQLSREMSDSGAPPIGSLVADAVTTGMHARRRRQGLLGGAVAGLVLVAVVGSVAVANGLPGSAPASLTQAGAPRGIGAVSSPAPSGAVPSGAVPSGAVPSGAVPSGAVPSYVVPSSIPKGPPTPHPIYASGKPVVELLEHLVAPHGHFTEVSFNQGSFLYNDGHGAATISADVSNAPASYGANVKGMACPALTPGLTCEVRHLSGGVVARIMTMGPYPGCTDAKCSIEDRRVEIQRTGGTYVTVDAFNGPEGHDRAATRAHTILSTSQLIAIATNSQWSLHAS